MKKLLVATAIACVSGAFTAPLMAADMAHMEHGAMHAAAAAQLADGVVKKVDKAAGTLTLAHGPLNGMPGMTMVFRVKESAWLDQLKAGQKIRFAAEELKGAMTVVRIEGVQ